MPLILDHTNLFSTEMELPERVHRALQWNIALCREVGSCRGTRRKQEEEGRHGGDPARTKGKHEDLELLVDPFGLLPYGEQ